MQILFFVVVLVDVLQKKCYLHILGVSRKLTVFLPCFFLYDILKSIVVLCILEANYAKQCYSYTSVMFVASKKILLFMSPIFSSFLCADDLLRLRSSTAITETRGCFGL